MWRPLRYILVFILLWVMCTFIVTIVAFPKLFADDWFQRFENKHKFDVHKRRNVSHYSNDSLVTWLHRDESPTEANVKSDTTKINGTYDNTSIQLSRFEYEKKYFTLRKNKVNKMDAEFVIVNRNFCEQFIPYLLVIVPSVHRNAEVRHAIRNTYGSQSMWKLDSQGANVTVKLLFLFGKNSPQLDEEILQESRKYGDIIQADFVDSYKNLTRKILYGLKWISTYCSEVEYVIKVDEDVFVNIPVLSEYLLRTPYGMKGAVYGYINKGSPVKRMGKWEVTSEQYPLKMYPDYASGNSYVISGNIIPRLFMVSEYMPYMPIEDAFITGCLAKLIDAQHIHHAGFTQWLAHAPDPCTFVRKRTISATKVTMSLFFKLWDAMQSYQTVCNSNV